MSLKEQVLNPKPKDAPKTGPKVKALTRVGHDAE